MLTIKNIITDPPSGSTYEIMKCKVLLQTSLSAKKKFETLVNDKHLGNCTPSQLLWYIRELAEDAPAHSALIKQLFFSILHQNVQAILAPMFEIISADHLTTSADRIVDIAKQPTSYATPQPQAEVSSLCLTPTHDTNQSLEQITKEVRKLNVTRSQSPRRRFQSRSPSPLNKQTRIVFLSQSFQHSSTQLQIALFFYKPGKLISGNLNTSQSPQALSNNRTFFLTDSISQAHCLVDTGTACSI